MSPQKPQFHNLHTLLPTQESRVQLSIFTGIPLTKINNWLDPDKKSVPKADSPVVMAKYFDCSVDYLLYLSDVKDMTDNYIKRMHKYL